MRTAFFRSTSDRSESGLYSSWENDRLVNRQDTHNIKGCVCMCVGGGGGGWGGAVTRQPVRQTGVVLHRVQRVTKVGGII